MLNDISVNVEFACNGKLLSIYEREIIISYKDGLRQLHPPKCPMFVIKERSLKEIHNQPSLSAYKGNEQIPKKIFIGDAAHLIGKLPPTK